MNGPEKGQYRLPTGSPSRYRDTHKPMLGTTVFSGLVQHVGRAVGIDPGGDVLRLRIDACGWVHVPAPGESIAVNGCCLTVAEPGGDLAFDVHPTTLERTMLGSLEPGDPVNLEHAATPTTLLGGHIVQGHVDGVGIVKASGDHGGGWTLAVGCPEPVHRYLVPRGSIALNGVSLTLADVDDGGFQVALIPTTLRDTSLGTLQVGDHVNLEADALARMVERLLTEISPR